MTVSKNPTPTRGQPEASWWVLFRWDGGSSNPCWTVEPPGGGGQHRQALGSMPASPQPLAKPAKPSHNRHHEVSHKGASEERSVGRKARTGAV
jgi:hypothetical protein